MHRRASISIDHATAVPRGNNAGADRYDEGLKRAPTDDRGLQRPSEMPLLELRREHDRINPLQYLHLSSRILIH